MPFVKINRVIVLPAGKTFYQLIKELRLAVYLCKVGQSRELLVLQIPCDEVI